MRCLSAGEERMGWNDRNYIAMGSGGKELNSFCDGSKYAQEV